MDIGLELRGIPEYLDQLGANVGRRGLDFIEPAEVVPVVEPNLGKLRKVVVVRLLVIDLPFSDQNVERSPEPCGGWRLDKPFGNEPIPEIGFELSRVTLTHRLSSAQLVAQVRRELFSRRGRLDRSHIER